MSVLPTQFKSNFKTFQAIVRHGYPILHPVTGTKTGEVKQLRADFGIHGGEYTVIDPLTGQENTFADIRGYFFDLDVAAEQNKWDEDEKEAVRHRLIELSEEWPEAVQIYDAPRAPAPWPTYDTTHHNKIPVLASELGLVELAISYESANKNRASVLKELAAVAPAAVVPEEELTAV